MRFSVLRLIAMRELRDLLRDRRSVLLILLMPLVLYPLLGLAGLSTVVFLAFALIALIFIRGNAQGRASADEPGPAPVAAPA